MGTLFGTDGVRGIANTELTCKLAFLLGQAVSSILGKSVVLGKDTRLSGDMIEAAVASGIMSAGGSALLVGVVPTPAVALLTRKMHADVGIVISASHNPPEYNGIKLFDACGFKLSDAEEDKIEQCIEVVLASDTCADWSVQADPPDGLGVGRVIQIESAAEIYIDHVVENVKSEGIDFSGMHVALDVGHGASAHTTAQALRRLGAQVSVINDDYDGTDINVACGSTHLDPLYELLQVCGADVGIAHDGDADRVMLMLPDGSVIDGDIIEAVCAADMKNRNILPENTVVSTVMCNLGFLHAMRDAGISVVQTKVGDRYVLEEMRAHGYTLGGEQSGHMIFMDYNTTGDGLMTACQFLAAVRRSGKSVAECIAVMTRFPQKLVNVRVSRKEALSECAPVWEAVRSVEDELGENGRVLVRTSGTEPLVRVMVEAFDQNDADRFAESIASVVEKELSEKA